MSVIQNDLQNEKFAVHPLWSRARVLLTSVFGPYGKDDEYGSRRINPMELYHNQVTRTQGPFSLRMFHRSWGLMMIQANITAPCMVLDFPTLDRFIEEIKTRQYDVIGISSIIPNILKVKKMCEIIRQYQPGAVIVIGGHIANVPDLSEKINADHIVKGEGVQWFRQYLGEDVNQPIYHPYIQSGFGPRNAGINLKGEIAATIIPSVGCPMGCNFCSTSAMFGGKGCCVHFYETGDELFDIMCQIEKNMHVRSFFVMDENFLFHRKRALRLLELMKQENKSWSLYVFSSAKVILSYEIEDLVRLGISWVWMGIEGKDSQYDKLKGVDTFELVRKLHSHGIRVLGSTIIGLENHTSENMDEVLDYAARHETDFHQFMLYTPIPGTPLHAELLKNGLMKGDKEISPPDVHGQEFFNYRHRNIPAGMESKFMLDAFNRDFEANGPSTVRIVRTTLNGWLRYKSHSDPCIRDRYVWESRNLGTTFSALTGATMLYYLFKPKMRKKMSDLLQKLHKEFGWRSRLYSVIGGIWVWLMIMLENIRLAVGFSHEPPTICERNFAVLDRPEIPLCESATPSAH